MNFENIITPIQLKFNSLFCYFFLTFENPTFGVEHFFASLPAMLAL